MCEKEETRYPGTALAAGFSFRLPGVLKERKGDFKERCVMR